MMTFKNRFLTIIAVLMLATTGTSGVHAAPREGTTEQDSLQAVNFIEALTPEALPATISAPPKKADVKKSAPAPELPPAPEPAPVEPAPVVEVLPPPVEAPPVVEVQSLPPAPEPAPVAVSDPPATSTGEALAASAYGQLGVAQDCTAMVENALRSVGIPVGDIAPAGFFAFGQVVGSPMVGDLVITGGHVAIYVGNGQVISGGLNGMNTGIHPLSDLAGASFVRVA